MTSDAGVDPVVEQPVDFHCCCGATIETSEKREICPDCGETVEVVRCVPTPHGKKYTLRISKHRKGRNTEPLLWAVAPQPGPATRARRHSRKLPDREKRFLRLGLLILLFAMFSILRFSVPGETYEEWIALANTHRPRDCDWTPLRDTPCHYESIFRRVNDQKGEHLVVEWHRVDD